MEIKIQLGKLDRFQREWVPNLSPQPVTQDRFKISFVGILQDESGIFLQGALHLLQRQAGIGHVVQGADHGGAIEGSGHERQAVDICGDEAVRRIFFPGASGHAPAG